MKLFLCSHFSSVGSLIKEEIDNGDLILYPACTTLHSKQKTGSFAMLTKNPPRTPPKREGSSAFFISCFLIDRPTA